MNCKKYRINSRNKKRSKFNNIIRNLDQKEIITMNIKPLLLCATLAITAQMTPISVQAEILAIGPNAKVLTKQNMPKFGQTKRSVSKKFGAAKRISVSKGKVTKRNPRITRWDYPTFSVFFENSHVIHSVVRR
ncbi:MAG: hypothetical protein ACI88H_001861 [Cocleimonas sp.]